MRALKGGETEIKGSRLPFHPFSRKSPIPYSRPFSCVCSRICTLTHAPHMSRPLFHNTYCTCISPPSPFHLSGCLESIKGGKGDAYITRRYRPRRTASKKGSFTPVLYTTLSRLLVGSPSRLKLQPDPDRTPLPWGKERDRYETALQAELNSISLRGGAKFSNLGPTDRPRHRRPPPFERAAEQSLSRRLK